MANFPYGMVKRPKVSRLKAKRPIVKRLKVKRPIVKRLKVKRPTVCHLTIVRVTLEHYTSRTTNSLSSEDWPTIFSMVQRVTVGRLVLQQLIVNCFIIYLLRDLIFLYHNLPQIYPKLWYSILHYCECSNRFKGEIRIE